LDDTIQRLSVIAKKPPSKTVAEIDASIANLARLIGAMSADIASSQKIESKKQGLQMLLESSNQALEDARLRRSLARASFKQEDSGELSGGDRTSFAEAVSAKKLLEARIAEHERALASERFALTRLKASENSLTELEDRCSDARASARKLRAA